jgi:EmrB/QacA subfamily drug resistance transporter
VSKKGLMLFTLILGVFMGALDTNIVSPALSSIISEFNVNTSWATWTVTIYTLVYAVSMPIIGKLADRFGGRRLYRIGIILFAIGSLLSALSTNMVMLALARSLQAIGGGGIFPVATAEVGNAFPPEKRGAALGIIGATFGVASILGPNVGSFLISHYSWHAIFWINIPISIIIICLTFTLPNEASESKPIDFFGAVLLSGIILCLMYGLTNLSPDNLAASFQSWRVSGFLLLSFVLIPLLVLWEKRVQDPIIDLNLFRKRELVVTFTLSVLTGATLATLFFVPMFAEKVLGIAIGHSGYIMTPLALASAISAGGGGKVLDSKGPKVLMLGGFTLFFVGCLMIVFWVSTLTQYIITLAVLGFALGMVIGAPLNYLVLNNVKKEESASSMAVLSLFRSLGTTIAPTIMATFITSAVQKIPSTAQETMKATVTKLAQTNPELLRKLPPMPAQAAGKNTDYVQLLNLFPPELANPIKAAIQELITHGFKQIYIAGLIITVAGVVLSLALSSQSKPQTQPGK